MDVLLHNTGSKRWRVKGDGEVDLLYRYYNAKFINAKTTPEQNGIRGKN
jgi:hypothetical protein